jgi:hypothetical protein
LIKDAITNIPSLSCLRVDIGDQSKGLLEFSNAKLDTALKDAMDLLRRFKYLECHKLENPKRLGLKRFKALVDLLHRGWDRVGLILKNDLIQELIRVVEYAKSSLQLALSTAMLSQVDSG